MEPIYEALPGRQLSWALWKEADPAITPGGRADLAHPLTIELAQIHGRDGIEAVHAWRRADDAHPYSAVVRWANAGAFKGRWESDEAFCCDQFASPEDLGAGSLLDHLATWDGARRGFSRWGELSNSAIRDLFDWTEWAEQTMNRRGAAFRSVPGRTGGKPQWVYVFDVTEGGAAGYIE
jgi:hypothetical protein